MFVKKISEYYLRKEKWGNSVDKKHFGNKSFVLRQSFCIVKCERHGKEREVYRIRLCFDILVNGFWNFFLHNTFRSSSWKVFQGVDELFYYILLWNIKYLFQEVVVSCRNLLIGKVCGICVYIFWVSGWMEFALVTGGNGHLRTFRSWTKTLTLAGWLFVREGSEVFV